MHKIECLVDVFQWHGMGNQIVNIDFLVHVPVDDFRHISTTACPTKGRAFPGASGYQLERSGRNFLPGTGYTDDIGFPQPL